MAFELSMHCGMAFELSMHSDRRWELLGSCVGLPYVFLESSCC